jgi:cytochrome P450
MHMNFVQCTHRAEQTVSAMGTFILAMLLHPSIQARAQSEIDAVTGGAGERLPTSDDRDKLPYVQALIKELFRWRPLAPVGLPHKLTKDDIYKGYLIPKGSVVLANIW